MIQLVGGRFLDSLQPVRHYICREAGNMAHQCPTLTGAQLKMVQKAPDNFLGSTWGRSQSTECHPKVDHAFHLKNWVVIV